MINEVPSRSKGIQGHDVQFGPDLSLQILVQFFRALGKKYAKATPRVAAAIAAADPEWLASELAIKKESRAMTFSSDRISACKSSSSLAKAAPEMRARDKAGGRRLAH
jgi:hypothetical protein